MPILVPQLSISCPSQASHTNKSMSGTASDTLHGSSASCQPAKSRSSAAWSAVPGETFLPLPPLSLSVHKSARSYVCTIAADKRSLPYVMHSAQDGRSRPGDPLGGEGAGLCPAYCQPGRRRCSAALSPLASGKAPRKLRHRGRIVDSPVLT